MEIRGKTIWKYTLQGVMNTQTLLCIVRYVETYMKRSRKHTEIMKKKPLLFGSHKAARLRIGINKLRT
jgi:hypothetical protein